MVEEISPTTDERSPPSKKRRKRWIWGYIALILILAIAIFIYWWKWLRFEEYTDDAYVAGNMVALTPQIPGIVVSIHADETDFVRDDQLIIELDSTDAAIAYEQKKSELAEALRQAVARFERVSQLRAEIEQKKAMLWIRALEYEHRKRLVLSGGVSLEDFEQSEAALRSSFSSLEDSEHMLTAAFAQIERTTVISHPTVKKAQEQLKEAYVLLNRCTIFSPVKGMIAQRNAQVGQHVKAGDKLLAIVPLDEIWVYANFKEVQLKKMRIGQPVKMTADLYGRSVVYHGKVVGIAAGTGSVFSLIPPQNATGNWIKIVQRLPVRIALHPQEILDYPLRLGLSMEVRVDIHNTEGSSLPALKSSAPVYETHIFEEQLVGVNKVIEEIIDQNVSSSFLSPDYYQNFVGFL